jgi:DNA replication protein DnaC
VSDVRNINPGIKFRNKYIANAKIPARFADAQVSELGESILPPCSRMLELCVAAHPVIQGIMLWGKPGRGKTRAMSALLREILWTAPHEWLGKEFGGILPVMPGAFMTYPELIRTEKKSFGSGEDAELHSEKLDALYCSSSSPSRNCRILALDDVGKEHTTASGFTVNVLHDLLRSRFDKSAVTLITTNLLPHQWEGLYGEAMASFIKEAFVQVEVKGADHRG